MFNNYDLDELMDVPLPGIYQQKRLCFRPSERFLNHTYELINYRVFSNNLKKPRLELHSNCKKYWAICYGNKYRDYTGSYCNIKLMDKWFCSQWFLNTLAHEMVHQYQWDIYRWEHLDYYGRPMYEKSGAHGPSFYMWRERFEHYGLNLKISFGQKRWFKHQDFNKC